MLDFIAQFLGHLFDFLGQAGSPRAWSLLIGLLVLISIACALLLWMRP